MRTTHGISALALTAALAIAPIAAKADLSPSQTASITAAVDAAMQSGKTSDLQALLSQLATANPNDAGAITDLVAQQISKDVAASPSAVLAGTETTIAEAVTSSAIVAIVAAAPGQAGTVLAEAQSNLTPDLTVAAVTATQTALAPAAGGTNQAAALRTDVNNLVSALKTLVQAIVQTAEQPRRSTASPSA